MSEQLTPTQRVEFLRNKPHGTLPLDWYLLSLELATDLERVKEKNAELVKALERIAKCKPHLHEVGSDGGCAYIAQQAIDEARE